MKIAVASGKGGTGKTTISTNLAFAVFQNGFEVSLIDCDVEEPNCHIFVKPEFEFRKQVTVPIPEIDTEKCTRCGKCSEVCEYNAIACVKDKVLVFPELCHGCGGCKLFCPENAITEKGRAVGVIEKGKAKGFNFLQGKLNIGEVMSPLLIREVKAAMDGNEITVIDAPPGTTCPVIEAVKDVDFVLLVTEPTPFGLNDLKLAVDMICSLNLPFAVIINRCDTGDGEVKQFCKSEDIEVVLEVPDSREIAEAYSRGEMAIETLPKYRDMFGKLYEKIQKTYWRKLNERTCSD